MKENQELEVLLHEHSIINKKIDDFINSQFVYITTLITMSAGFVYYSFEHNNESNDFQKLIIYLPYLIILIAPTFLYKFYRAILLHGYRSYIEKKINFNLGKNVISGGNLVKEKLLATNPFVILNYIVMLFSFFSSVYFCHINSDKFFNTHFFIQISIIIFLLIIFIVFVRKVYENGFQFANKRYNQEQLIICSE